MPADHDGDRPGAAVAQDRIDVVEGHAVHGGLIDFHNLIAAPAEARTGGCRHTHCVAWGMGTGTHGDGRGTPAGPLHRP